MMCLETLKLRVASASAVGCSVRLIGRCVVCTRPRCMREIRLLRSHMRGIVYLPMGPLNTRIFSCS